MNRRTTIATAGRAWFLLLVTITFLLQMEGARGVAVQLTVQNFNDAVSGKTVFLKVGEVIECRDLRLVVVVVAVVCLRTDVSCVT
jgi:hypothetical protein